MTYEEWGAKRDEHIAKSIYSEDIALRDFTKLHGTPPAPRGNEPDIVFEAPEGIAKAKDDNQTVFGWANVSVKADGQLPHDWDGDIKTPETLETAAYDYVLKSRVANEQHERNDEVRGHLIESVMFTKEKMKAMGIPEGTVPEAWWVGFHIPDKEVFEKVKKGKYKMFSIEGKATRIPLDGIGGK